MLVSIPANVANPVLFQALSLGRLDDIGDRPRAAVFHHKPQLVVLARRALLYEGSVVGGDVAVVRILL